MTGSYLENGMGIDRIIKSQNVEARRDYSRSESRKRFIGFFGKTLLLLTALTVAYIVAERNAPEHLKPSTIKKKIECYFNESKELLYFDGKAHVFDSEPEEITDNSIDKIVLQWEKTRNCIVIDENEDKWPTKYDIGVMYCFKDGKIVKKIENIAGGFYVSPYTEDFEKSGIPTSPHNGLYQLKNWIPKPDFHTPNHYFPSGAKNNPFGDAIWEVYQNGKKLGWQFHGMRPINNGKKPTGTNGCIRTTNQNITDSRYWFKNGASLIFTEVPYL